MVNSYFLLTPCGPLKKPYTLLPYFSKVLDQFLNFLSKVVDFFPQPLAFHEDIFDKCQSNFSFRALHNTESALLEVTGDLLLVVDRVARAVSPLLDIASMMLTWMIYS